jgi:cytochrome b subunit of formate dehydrogenase
MQQPADRPAIVPQSLDRGVALFIALGATIVILIVTIGVVLFRRWARSAYVAITALYFFALFFARASVLPSSAFAVFALGYFVQGVIIAMMFLPPVSSLFVSKRSNQSLEPTTGRRDEQI